MAAATAAENPMLMSDEAETQLKKMNFGLIKQCDMTEEMRHARDHGCRGSGS
jgi:hypothetical protein